MAYKQARRNVKIGTTLGEDAVQLVWFSGREEISRLFKFNLQLISMNPKIDATELVSQNLTFSVDFNDGSPRHFNGFVRQMSGGDESDKGRRGYSLEVVPWLWFLTQTTDCRIFQDKTVVEIITETFNELGFSDFETTGIQGTHPKREYCVQYRETDFDFVSRLMEEEGIFYFFRHEDGKHVMVMADDASVYKDCKEAKVDFPADEQESHHKTPHIHSWEHVWQFQTGAWAHTDYNFKTPRQQLLTNEKTVMKFKEVAKYEQFDYPGMYPDKGIGKPLSRVRMEEIESPHDIVQATSGCQSFSPGCRFSIGKHRVPAENGKSYVIRAIQHECRETNYESGEESGFDYRNQFECFPDSVKFRPARETAKAVVRGCQTAVVTGPAGEEIHTDEYGRVKVQFHWDRYGKYDDQSSCWIRCAQNIAGKHWGFMTIPRVGQEVVVDFLEGDPDRPLIVGVVYNAEQMPHYGLPGEKTKSYFKSNSSKGGDGHNEIRFEDKKGAEQIYIHGEKNLDIRIKNDAMELILHDRHLIVGAEKDGKKVGDQREMVYQDKHLNVKRNHVEHIEGNMELMIGNGKAADGGKLDVVVEKKMTELIGKEGFHLHVEGDRTVQIDGGDSLSVGGNSSSAIKGNRSAQVKGDDKTKMDGSMSLDIGGDYQEKSGGKHAVEAGQEIHIKAGMKVIIEAGLQLSLVGPGGFIDIGPAGVSIQGTMVLINSGGAAGSGSGSSPAAPDKPAGVKKAKKAKPVVPTIADNSTTGQKSSRD